LGTKSKIENLLLLKANNSSTFLKSKIT
jgi:hypothetical protein